MSRVALLVWVLSPLLVIGALALMMDRSRGRPDPRLEAINQARLPGQAADSSRSAARIEREVAETEARKAASGESGAAPAVTEPAPQPAAGPKMVQPESLPQGFIIVVDDTTKGASDASPIYLASSHNGWNPGDPNMKLTRRSDMRWQIVLPKPTLDSKMAFKFTRGTWDLVEVNADGQDIDNRLLPMIDASKLEEGEQPVIELMVPRWKNPAAARPGVLDPYRAIDVAAGSIRRVEVVGGGGFTGSRDLLVWLPPGYDATENAGRQYPVLYMADGQNLFDKHDMVPAEWRMDETAGRLIAQNEIEPLIVVGIPHAGAGRTSEYSPVQFAEGAPPRADSFVRFLLNEVKPRIDASFRTASGPENTAIGGASMGGVIAIEASTQHPEVFGKVLAESTPLAYGDRALFRHFGAKAQWPRRVYFGMGGKEGGDDPAKTADNRQWAASADAFGELLKGRGFTGENLRIVVDQEALHNEDAWAKRLPDALKFLFPAKPGAAQ